MTFENIKNINTNNIASWQDKIFLTFDIDWCSDEILSYTLDIIEKYDIKATFFVTHETILLERMRKNPNIELGIHPNFNFLLNGDFRQGKTINEVIEYYKKIVPDAVSVRSHGMTQNSYILDSFDRYGLTHDNNTFVPFSSGIQLSPWKHWTDNLVKIPYFWEDDVHCMYQWGGEIDKYLTHNGLKVFDFHPIHIMLNTEKMTRYEDSRKYHDKYEQLQEYVNKEEYGSCDFLFDLIEKGKIK